ncbi:unnamed protein product, partial [Amoebophrya sp. A25]|eukprot:GSA25T00004146001.1
MCGREIARNVHLRLRELFPYNSALPVSCMRVSLDAKRNDSDASYFSVVSDRDEIEDTTVLEDKNAA